MMGRLPHAPRSDAATRTPPSWSAAVTVARWERGYIVEFIARWTHLELNVSGSPAFPVCRLVTNDAGRMHCADWCKKRRGLLRAVRLLTKKVLELSPNSLRRTATNCLQAASVVAPKPHQHAAGLPNAPPSTDIGCFSTSKNPGSRNDSRKDAYSVPPAAPPEATASQQWNFHLPDSVPQRRPAGRAGSQPSLERARNKP
jgi:hypothetical protein